MPDQSIRGYLASLQQHNEITRFTREVDPDRNVSALSWRNYAQRGKACLFENVKGHPEWRVVSQIIADRRKWALALGVSEDEVVATLSERITKPVAPVMVGGDRAPVREVIQLGAEVDLTKIPAMWTSEADPGRYIASGMCIIKDPHTGIRNVSFHRAQVIGPNTTGYLICPRQALKIYQMYGELKRPMEAAMVIGAHPAVIFSAGFVAPYGLDELSIAGGLLGEPIRMVKCETIDMEVPADAELVLEGELLPGEMTPEGPFGEVTGGYAQEGSTPLFRVKAITRRKDPIFYAMQCGLPPSDAHSIVCTTIEMRLWQHLKSVAGGLDLIDLRCIAGMSPMMVVVKLRQRFAGQARAALLAVLSSPYLHPKIAVAVDEDIDIRDLRQVYWAMTHRAHEALDLQKIDRARVFALDNASPIEEGMSAMYRVGTKVLIDATEDPATPKAQRQKPPSMPEGEDAAARKRIAAALGIGYPALLADLAKRVDRDGTLAKGASARKKATLAALPSGITGAILAVGGETPALGLVSVSREAGQRLNITHPSWRLADTLRMRGGGALPAALVVGASEAAQLGAALCGWRGRPGWAHAASLSGGGLTLSPTANGVAVPAAAKLVIEGWLRLGGGDAPAWSFEATGASADGAPAAGDVAAIEAVAIELVIAQHISPIESGLDILDVRCYPETDNRLVVVKIRPRVDGQAKTACMGALSSPEIGPRLVIAVDDDIDPDDLRDVSWSFASRVHAEYDVQAIDGLPDSAANTDAIKPGFKWFVDAAKPPLTQTAKREEWARARPKNLDGVTLDEFLPD